MLPQSFARLATRASPLKQFAQVRIDPRSPLLIPTRKTYKIPNALSPILTPPPPLKLSTRPICTDTAFRLLDSPPNPPLPPPLSPPRPLSPRPPWSPPDRSRGTRINMDCRACSKRPAPTRPPTRVFTRLLTLGSTRDLLRLSTTRPSDVDTRVSRTVFWRFEGGRGVTRWRGIIGRGRRQKDCRWVDMGWKKIRE